MQESSKATQKSWDNPEVAISLLNGMAKWIIREKGAILIEQNNSLKNGDTNKAIFHAGKYEELLGVEAELKSLHETMTGK